MTDQEERSPFHPGGAHTGLLGRRMMQALRRQERTIDEMAANVGRSRRTIARWRSGSSIPGIEEAIRIARFLRIDDRTVIEWVVDATYERLRAQEVADDELEAG